MCTHALFTLFSPGLLESLDQTRVMDAHSDMSIFGRYWRNLQNYVICKAYAKITKKVQKKITHSCQWTRHFKSQKLMQTLCRNYQQRLCSLRISRHLRNLRNLRNEYLTWNYANYADIKQILSRYYAQIIHSPAQLCIYYANYANTANNTNTANNANNANHAN